MIAARSNSTDTPSPTTRIFVYVVTAAGATVLGLVLSGLSPGVPPIQWLLLLVLTALSETFGIKLPSLRARLTVSESFVFTSIFLFGTGPSVLLVLIDGLLVPLWQRRRHNLHRFLFNTFEPVLSVWLASEVFFRVSGLAPVWRVPAETTVLLVPALLVPSLYFLTNSSLTAVAMALDEGSSPLVIWRRHFVWLSFNCFVAASIAGLLVQNPHVFLGSFAMALPLLLVSYFVFRSSIGRVDDAQRHIDELRRLYLSTIEAFAIAVDAKDHVTHGHIRRVQQFALRLAKALRVEDEPTLRAIEAAGLLHDIGKLAIPDHILNKPGKLTAAEFERMKLHADAGAQILSAIEFPFPVVPIVRHHHENWDGSGYPSGVSGDAIPLGARILAVVDCFDALTSDRPYRRALSAEQALDVLIERRGTMYDPVVVDTFLRIYRETADLDVLPSTQHHLLAGIARSASTTVAAGAFADDAVAIPGDDPGKIEWNETGSIAERAASAIETFLPGLMVAIYAYVSVRDEVVLVYQRGGAFSLVGCRLPLGRTLTGWAAANRAAVVNGDPSLDFEAFGTVVGERMRSCLAMPLTVGDRLVGVLTLYSNKERAFDVRARQLAEGFAAYLGPWLDEAHAAAGAYPQKGATSHDGLKPVAELRSLQDHKRDRVQMREPNVAAQNLASSL